MKTQHLLTTSIKVFFISVLLILTACGDGGNGGNSGSVTLATERFISVISVDNEGIQSDDDSYDPSISADGRYVAFESDATNLVIGDTNGFSDIFLHNSQAGTTAQVSVGYRGELADDDSYEPSISAGGRYVAFESDATNLVIGDTNGYRDIFLYNAKSGITRVSVDYTGESTDDDSTSPSISADGRYVAFVSAATSIVSGDTNGFSDIFVHDTQTGTTTQVSMSRGRPADQNSDNPSISGDGRYVAFVSAATNLVSGDTNVYSDIFVHDTQTGATTRVSVDSEGTQSDGPSFNPSISADGRYVAFESYANNLVDDDEYGLVDIFVHDTQTGTTTRVSVDSAGMQGMLSSYNPSISGDGRYVAFQSFATNLVDGGETEWTDVFLHDTQTGATTQVSVNGEGTQGDDYSYNPSISGDGGKVAFESSATNFLGGGKNGATDIFLAQTSVP